MANIVFIKCWCEFNKGNVILLHTPFQWISRGFGNFKDQIQIFSALSMSHYMMTLKLKQTIQTL